MTRPFSFLCLVSGVVHGDHPNAFFPPFEPILPKTSQPQAVGPALVFVESGANQSREREAALRWLRL